jgi:hypothetical protein
LHGVVFLTVQCGHFVPAGLDAAAPIAFLQDDLSWSHRKAVLVTSTVIFLAAHVSILGLASGALDEIDSGCLWEAFRDVELMINASLVGMVL